MTDARKASSNFAHTDPRQKISSIKRRREGRVGSDTCSATPPAIRPLVRVVRKVFPRRPYRLNRILIQETSPPRASTIAYDGRKQQNNKTVTDLAANGSLNEHGSSIRTGEGVTHPYLASHTHTYIHSAFSNPPLRHTLPLLLGT